MRLTNRAKEDIDCLLRGNVEQLNLAYDRSTRNLVTSYFDRESFNADVFWRLYPYLKKEVMTSCRKAYALFINCDIKNKNYGMLKSDKACISNPDEKSFFEIVTLISREGEAEIALRRSDKMNKFFLKDCCKLIVSRLTDSLELVPSITKARVLARLAIKEKDPYAQFWFFSKAFKTMSAMECISFGFDSSSTDDRTISFCADGNLSLLESKNYPSLAKRRADALNIPLTEDGEVAFELVDFRKVLSSVPIVLPDVIAELKRVFENSNFTPPFGVMADYNALVMSHNDDEKLYFTEKKSKKTYEGVVSHSFRRSETFTSLRNAVEKEGNEQIERKLSDFLRYYKNVFDELWSYYLGDKYHYEKFKISCAILDMRNIEKAKDIITEQMISYAHECISYDIVLSTQTGLIDEKYLKYFNSLPSSARNNILRGYFALPHYSDVWYGGYIIKNLQNYVKHNAVDEIPDDFLRMCSSSRVARKLGSDISFWSSLPDNSMAQLMIKIYVEWFSFEFKDLVASMFSSLKGDAPRTNLRRLLSRSICLAMYTTSSKSHWSPVLVDSLFNLMTTSIGSDDEALVKTLESYRVKIKDKYTGGSV